MKESLQELFTRAATEDREAFDEWVRQTHRTVYQLVFRMVGRRAESEEIVQEAYLRAWHGMKRLRDPAVSLGWLCRIARNCAVDTRRRKQLPITYLEDDELLAPDALDDPEQQLAQIEANRQVRDAVSRLGEKHRLVLFLREVDELSYEEMAAALGCPVGTVESRLFRARKALAKQLQTQGWKG